MIRVRGRGAVTALLVSLCFLLLAGAARADGQYDVGPSPVLKVVLTGGNLVVQHGDGPQVSVASAGTVNVQHYAAGSPGADVPAQIQIPPQTAVGPDGPVPMARETFVMPSSLGTAQHDAIVVTGRGDTTITVPRGTALVFARSRTGHITLANYSGAFFAYSRTGGVDLQHVSGTGFAESLRGPVTAEDSTFTRLRVRTAISNITLHGCTSRQIQASSTYGSIVYDNGQFERGLARFESQHGDVAIGVQNEGGGVQIGAHSGSGRVVSNFADGTPVSGGASDTQATIRGGGPVVTTSTQDGSVYLYNGAMSAHPSVQQSVEQSGDPYAAARGVAPAYGTSGHTQLPQRDQQPPRYQQAPARYQPPRYQPPPQRYRPAPQSSPEKHKGKPPF